MILSENPVKGRKLFAKFEFFPLQGNAVLGTNSIPFFSPVGIMPLYLQTLCHGNVQEGLKQLRNALPSYIFSFYCFKATVYSYAIIKK